MGICTCVCIGRSAFFEVVGVVPLAILSGMHPVPTAVIGFIGNFFTVLLLIVFVDRFKAWRLKRKEDKSDEKGEKKQQGPEEFGNDMVSRD